MATQKRPVPAPSDVTPAHDHPGLAARRLAVAAIDEVLRSGAALDECFGRLAAASGLPSGDQALARAIAVVAFRRLGSLRAALAERAERGLPERAGPLEPILLVGAAQLLHLDVADHAAVDLAIRLLQEDGRSARYAGLGNALLRRIAKERDAILAMDDSRPFLDTPDWLAARWRAHYGEETARAIARAHRAESPLDVTVRGEPERWAQALGGDRLPTGSIRLEGRGAIAELPGFAEGAWWVQDAAAALPARLLEPRAGERIADLCAAPGGKTAQLAAAGARVTAVDRSAPRLARLRENLARLGLAAEIRVGDAARLEAEPFDAVLLDAPCSATGTIRRHPDVAWTKTEEDVAKLARLQASLLDAAARMTRPGGRLIYCTCSLEVEEGEAQVEAFLARHPEFRRRPIEPSEIGDLPEAIDGNGDLRTLPHQIDRGSARQSGWAGFYASRLIRL